MIKKIVILCLVMFTACAVTKEIKNDPFYETFFEKTRFIMTNEEIEIYKHLPDRESKEKFIKDFWYKRDPDPETKINEAKVEYQERINFCNRYFRENKPKGNGWNTERGRILLQLGVPDRREWGEAGDYDYSSGIAKLRSTKRRPMEIWYYYVYQLRIIFVDDTGFNKFKLLKIPAALLTSIDYAKYTLTSSKTGNIKNAFKFKASFSNNTLNLIFPVNRLSFKEDKNNVISELEIEYYVYLDYSLLEKIRVKKTINKDSKEILDLKKISLTIPYTPKKKGVYYFDIIIREIYSTSKYRNFCKFRY